MKNSIKKILIAHSSNDNYGSSKVLISIVNILIKNGFDIYLILPHNGPLSDNEIIKKAKIKIINLGVFRKKYFSFFGLINRLYYIIKSSFHIKNILKKDKIDLVYTNTSTIISPAIAAKFLGLRSIYHIHEIPSSNYIYSRFIVNFLNYFSDNVIAVSNAVHEFWLNRGVRGSKINVIYNGFKYSPKPKKKRPKNKIIFTSISRIIPYKGHSLMIDIFEKLYKKNSTLYLKIIGDTLPEYKKYLSDLKFKVEKKGLSNNISFLGFQDDVMKMLSKSSFFIHLPTSPDPLPTVIFEAIKSKTPIITNNLGGAIEILNNGNFGLIIENNLIDDSVEKILNFINNKKNQNDNVDNAYDYVCKNYSYEKFRKQILNLFE